MKIVLAQLTKDIKTSRALFWVWASCVVVILGVGLSRNLSLGNMPRLSEGGASWMIPVSLLMSVVGVFAAQFVLMTLLVVRLVQADSLTDPDAYWRTRPIKRGTLLGAKGLYVGILVAGAMLSALALNFGKAGGGPFSTLVTFVLGLMAFAAISSNLTELILSWLGVTILAYMGVALLSEISRLMGFIPLESAIQDSNVLRSMAGEPVKPWIYGIYWGGFLAAICCQYFTLRTNVSRLILLVTYLLPLLLGSR